MLNVYKLGLLENVMLLSEKVTYLFSIAPYLLLVGHTYQCLVHRVVGYLYCQYVFRASGIHRTFFWQGQKETSNRCHRAELCITHTATKFDAFQMIKYAKLLRVVFIATLSVRVFYQGLGASGIRRTFFWQGQKESSNRCHRAELCITHTATKFDAFQMIKYAKLLHVVFISTLSVRVFYQGLVFLSSSQ
jgi:hypothetical protein